MKVLLVEPDYKVRFAPLGLMKLSAMYKAEGHEVTFVRGRKKIYDLTGHLVKFDVVCITSLFTYYYKETINAIKYYQKYQADAEIKVGGIFASIMPEYIERYTGIVPHHGLYPLAENQIPDQSIVKKFYKDTSNRDTDYKANYDGHYEYTSLVFTSRGCIRKCKFCVVPKIEGKLTLVENWTDYVDLNKPTITFMDNNWFSKPIEVIKEDVKKIKYLQTKGIKNVDFNQALDARLFTPEIAKLLEGVRLKPLRFAFDNKSEDGAVQKALRLGREHGLMHCKANNRDWNAKQSNTSIYVLYNFDDDPEFFYHRIREIVKAGGAPTPLKYCPINSVRKDFMGPKWNSLYIKNIQQICTILFSRLGSITPIDREEFEWAFGKDSNEFIKIISDKNLKPKLEELVIEKKINRRREVMGLPN